MGGQRAPFNPLMGYSLDGMRGFDYVRPVRVAVQNCSASQTLYTCPTGAKAIVYGHTIFNTNTVGPVGYTGYFGSVATANQHVSVTLASGPVQASMSKLEPYAVLLNAGDTIIGAAGAVNSINVAYAVYEVPASAPITGFKGTLTPSGSASAVYFGPAEGHATVWNNYWYGYSGLFHNPSGATQTILTGFQRGAGQWFFSTTPIATLVTREWSNQAALVHLASLTGSLDALLLQQTTGSAPGVNYWGIAHEVF